MWGVKPKRISSVAIVGAGMAGVSCGVALSKSIPSVKIFEKSHTAGGRMMSRVRDGYEFDCGAQYFTVRTPVFEQQIKAWQAQWLVDEWRAWIVDLQDGEALSRDDDAKRFVGRPQMHSCVEDMASLCDVQFKTVVARIEKVKKVWRLFDATDSVIGDFDAVIVAVPAPQAIPLLSEAPALASLAAGVNMTPCWSVMLAFEESLKLGFDAAFLVTSKLSWVARNSSKSERGGVETWVLHGSPEWSEPNAHWESIDVIEILMKDMEHACRREFPMPEFADAKLWRHSLAVNPLGKSALYDEKLRIGACGDWCNVGRVEGAYLSGLSMAMQLLKGND